MGSVVLCRLGKGGHLDGDDDDRVDISQNKWQFLAKIMGYEISSSPRHSGKSAFKTNVERHSERKEPTGQTRLELSARTVGLTPLRPLERRTSRTLLIQVPNTRIRPTPPEHKFLPIKSHTTARG